MRLLLRVILIARRAPHAEARFGRSHGGGVGEKLNLVIGVLTYSGLHSFTQAGKHASAGFMSEEPKGRSWLTTSFLSLPQTRLPGTGSGQRLGAYPQGELQHKRMMGRAPATRRIAERSTKTGGSMADMIHSKPIRSPTEDTGPNLADRKHQGGLAVKSCEASPSCKTFSLGS